MPPRHSEDIALVGTEHRNTAELFLALCSRLPPEVAPPTLPARVSARPHPCPHVEAAVAFSCVEAALEGAQGGTVKRL